MMLVNEMYSGVEIMKLCNTATPKIFLTLSPFEKDCLHILEIQISGKESVYSKTLTPDSWKLKCCAPKCLFLS